MQNSASHKVWNILVFLNVIGLISFMMFISWTLAAGQTGFDLVENMEGTKTFAVLNALNGVSVVVLMIYAIIQSVRGSSTVFGKIGWTLLSAIGSFLLIVIPVLQFTVFKKWDAERVAAKNLSSQQAQTQI